MRIVKSVFVLSLLLSFVACNNAVEPQKSEDKSTSKKQDKSTIENWNKQENNDLEIFYPPDWIFDASGKMGALFIILSPMQGDSDKFQDNINLIAHPLKSDDIDLKKFYLASIDDLKRQLEIINIQEEEKIVNNGIEIQKVIFTTAQESIVLMIQQYYYVYNESAYVMTFTAEETEFDDSIKIADLIMNSFKFKTIHN